MALKNCRECGQQVSTEAESCPHCGVPSPTCNTGAFPEEPPPSGDSWESYVRFKLRAGATPDEVADALQIHGVPPERGRELAQQQGREIRSQRRRDRDWTAGGAGTAEAGTLGQDEIIGLVGAGLLFVGVFLPLISAPVVGPLNYFQNGTGDGVIVLLMAAITAYMCFMQKTRLLVWPGGISLAMLAFTFINFQVQLGSATDQMQRDLEGNPFQGLGELAMQSVQMQWGWPVLILGGILVFAAGIKAQNT